MNALPVITVTPNDGGWIGMCDRCGWQLGHRHRPHVDIEARDHRARCAMRRD